MPSRRVQASPLNALVANGPDRGAKTLTSNWVLLGCGCPSFGQLLGPRGSPPKRNAQLSSFAILFCNGTRWPLGILWLHKVFDETKSNALLAIRPFGLSLATEYGGSAALCLCCETALQGS